MQQKLIVLSTLLVVLLILCTGCTTTEKFHVCTIPNSEIKLPGTPQGGFYTNQLGEASITIPSNDYIGYVTIHNSSYPFEIPMGLDIRKKNVSLAQFGRIVSYTGSGIGVIGMIGMLVGAIAGDDASDFAAASGIIGASGLAMMGSTGPAVFRLNQCAYKYKFTYVNNQILDVPQLSVTLLHPDPVRSVNSSAGMSKRKKALSEPTDQGTGEEVSKSKRSRSNLAGKVSGTYAGSGDLSIGRNVEETYDLIEIMIKSIDKNHVQIFIIEDGEEFFDKPLTFKVKESKSGYSLIHPKIPSIQCTISKDGHLSINHPKVNIDDNIFTLRCNAKRK